MNLLPNFKKIIEGGISAELQVTIPHQTIPSWPCLFSGQTVEQLGFYTFIQPGKGIFNSHVWREKSVLSLLDERIFSINLPGTYPAWRINGEMITGILSPEISCFPKEMELEVKRDWIIEGRDLKNIFKAFELKKKIFLRKLKEDFSLLIFVIRVPDAISHRILGDKDLVLKYMQLGYQKIDEFLGEMMENEEIDNLILFSDHGLKYYNKVLNFARWLEKKKLLYLNPTQGNKLNSIILKLYDIIRPLVKIQVAKRFYNKLPMAKKREAFRYQERKLTKIDTENPETFIQKLTSNMCALFLHGPDRKKKNLFRKMFEKEKIIDNFVEYDREGFPDFLIALKDKYWCSKEPSLFVKRNNEAFGHTNRGFFLAYGKNIKPNNINTVNYIDVAPTIFKLFGKEKASYMTGKALDIFK